jgi:hypothetical protein
MVFEPRSSGKSSRATWNGFSVSCTMEEKRAILDRCDELHMNLSNYVRHAIALELKSKNPGGEDNAI